MQMAMGGIHFDACILTPAQFRYSGWCPCWPPLSINSLRGTSSSVRCYLSTMGLLEYCPLDLILLIPYFQFPLVFGELRRLFTLLVSECTHMVSVSLLEGVFRQSNVLPNDLNATAETKTLAH